MFPAVKGLAFFETGRGSRANEHPDRGGKFFSIAARKSSSNAGCLQEDGF
jgi:hypothetical protein